MEQEGALVPFNHIIRSGKGHSRPWWGCRSANAGNKATDWWLPDETPDPPEERFVGIPGEDLGNLRRGLMSVYYL